MRLKNTHYHEWKKRHDNAKFLHEQKRKQKRKKSFKNVIQTKERVSDNQIEHTFTVPSNFSITGNSEEVIKFFNKVISYRTYGNSPVKIMVNMAGVRNITIDALMYLLSIIKNKRFSETQISLVRGNLPDDGLAADLVKRSGFLRHLRSASENIIYSEDIVSIKTGDKVDSETLGDICQFVKNKAPIIENSTKKIYTIIGEMMGNAQEHAYGAHQISSLQNWLCYVEKRTDKMIYIFLDTGYGIPTTVQKKSIEKIVRSDRYFLESALEGKTRTRTKKIYRGRGLPGIVSLVKSNVVNNMTIITNKACCIINYGRLNFVELEHSFQGTLYYFEQFI
jgi:hypothetical protein